MTLSPTKPGTDLVPEEEKPTGIKTRPPVKATGNDPKTLIVVVLLFLAIFLALLYTGWQLLATTGSDGPASDLSGETDDSSLLSGPLGALEDMLAGFLEDNDGEPYPEPDTELADLARTEPETPDETRAQSETPATTTGPESPEESDGQPVSDPTIELESALATGVSLPDPLVGLLFSGAVDYSRLSFIREPSRQRLQEAYAEGKAHKAIAVHPDGNWAYFAGQESWQEAARRTLQRCEIGAGSPCYLFAIDGSSRNILPGQDDAARLPGQILDDGDFNPARVPFIRDEAFGAMESYARGPEPKALVLSRSGYYYFVTGFEPGEHATVRDAVLARCQEKGRKDCMIYADGNNIVLNEQQETGQ